MRKRRNLPSTGSLLKPGAGSPMWGPGGGRGPSSVSSSPPSQVHWLEMASGAEQLALDKRMGGVPSSGIPL